MLSVIIPARNGKAFTANCLSSALFSFNSFEENLEYLLIDDNSEGSDIKELFIEFRNSTKAQVKIFQFRERQHYTGVFTCGLSQAQGDLVMFLSNDMMITPYFIKTLLTVASLEDSIGIVRGTSQYTDSHPEHQCPSPFPIRGYQDVLDFSSYVSKYYGVSYVVDNLLSGDAILIKRKLIDKIGVMDIRFFGYFGDVDYGLRAQRAGFKLACAKGAWLHHEGAGHVKQESTNKAEDFKVTHQSRMELVQIAYSKFREKWDGLLPGVYSGLDPSIFEKLRLKENRTFSEYEKPISLNLSICEVL